MKLGVHLPFDGFSNTLYNAKYNGLETFQMFIRNNRNMIRRDYSAIDINNFNTAIIQGNIKQYVVHASYALNPASPTSDTLNRTREIVSEDLVTMQHLGGVKHYVLHPGSATDGQVLRAIETLCESIHIWASQYKGTRICIEFMAGQGNQIICTKEQLVTLIKECSDVPEFRVCLDTCHCFAAGVTVSEILSRLYHESMLDKIGVLHVNGSKTTMGSYVDRHESLSKGYIPFDFNLQWVKQVDELTPEDIPVILETPEAYLFEDYQKLKDHLFIQD